jgi:hypothetical protein
MRRVVLERGGERATAPPLIEVVARPEGSQVALGEPRPSFTLDVVGGYLVPDAPQLSRVRRLRAALSVPWVGSGGRVKRDRYRGTTRPGTRRRLVPITWAVPCPVCGCPRYRAVCRLGRCTELPYTGNRNPEGPPVHPGRGRPVR